MNEEKKIAKTMLDSVKMRRNSYVEPSDNGGVGGYKRSMKFCLIVCGKKNGLSENLWELLNLAMHWNKGESNAVFWAEDVLEGRKTPPQLPCCEESNSKEQCEQCQEIGLANPLNH